jgi:hypothetical protein
VRRLGVVLAAMTMLVALASPAPAANELRTQNNRMLVTIPIRIAGGLDEAEAIGKLNGQGERLGADPLFGCFAVVPSVAAEPGPDAHLLTVLPQRPGQFVRPSASGSTDPFAGPREVVVGSMQLDAADPLEGPLPLLLAELPRTGEEDFLSSVLERATTEAGLDPLTPCRWKGVLALRAAFERYHLTVRSDVPFVFAVRPDGEITARMGKMVRAATAEDPELGHCTTEDAPGFGIRVTGTADAGRFAFEFTPRGREVDFTMSCSGGDLEIGGDYLRAAFQPQGRLVLEVAPRQGATAATKAAIQGRTTSSRVTVDRV